MSDSPKPSPVAGISMELDFPGGMFFRALDYAPTASAKARPSETQVKVARARAKAIVDLHQLKDKLGNALAHLRTADDYGQVTGSMDVLVSLADEIHDEVLKFAKLADNAEARFKGAVEDTPMTAADGAA